MQKVNNVSNEIIGIIGGFGSYATLHFFKRILEAFPAEKEWERPRLIIDNYCTLPSRVRCILYGEKQEEIINGLTNSIQNLIDNDVTYIIITCNTAHYFLGDIYKNIPESKNKIINIIEETAINLKKNHVDEVSLIASEGTIISKIYHNIFKEYGIKIYNVDENEFYKIRELIEIVKQNKIIDNTVKNKFIDLLLKQKSKNIILGCSEFPILYDEVKEEDCVKNINIYDPLQITIDLIKK